MWGQSIWIGLKLSCVQRKSTNLSHLHFVGPGLVSSVAYIDPGNWATDLQAGSKFGYKLLFVVLIAGLAAVGESDIKLFIGFKVSRVDVDHNSLAVSLLLIRLLSVLNPFSSAL